MLIYEITARVESERREDYERYMKERHIPDVLSTGAFTGGQFERSVSNELFRTRFFCPTREILDRYLAEYAPALRTDFKNHFETGVELEREQWRVIAKFA